MILAVKRNKKRGLIKILILLSLVGMFGAYYFHVNKNFEEQQLKELEAKKALKLQEEKKEKEGKKACQKEKTESYPCGRSARRARGRHRGEGGRTPSGARGRGRGRGTADDLGREDVRPQIPRIRLEGEWFALYVHSRQRRDGGEQEHLQNIVAE